MADNRIEEIRLGDEVVATGGHWVGWHGRVASLTRCFGWVRNNNGFLFRVSRSNLVPLIDGYSSDESKGFDDVVDWEIVAYMIDHIYGRNGRHMG